MKELCAIPANDLNAPHLCLIMPAFNEDRQVGAALTRVLNGDASDWQVIVVDDASTDRTVEAVNEASEGRVELVLRTTNGGKTAAVRDGLALARSQWVVIQDADLEYDPADLPRLLAVAQERGGAVFGRRPSMWHRPRRWGLAAGVLFIDLCLLAVYGRWVRDHATCYKILPTQMLRDLSLESTGFEGCVEITAKLMRSGVSIHQIPIRYNPRTSAEGKKLTWRYGFVALQAVWKWRKWTPDPSNASEPSLRSTADECVTVP